MSKFSGKCDFCDTIEICGLEKILNSKIYLGKSEIPLEIFKPTPDNFVW